MKLTYDNQTIDFFSFERLPNRVLLALSGGLDSASLMYLICNHFPQIEIVPWHGNNVNTPRDLSCAINVVNWMKEQFPEVNIHDLVVRDFDDQDESVYPIVRNIIDGGDEAYVGLDEEQAAKVYLCDIIRNDLLTEYDVKYSTTAQTSNPPIIEMSKHRLFLEKSEIRRNKVPGQPHWHIIGRIYQPFVNVDKKFVADIYRQHNLMYTLFPLTNSCVGDTIRTNNFTKECMKCFWCFEKRWAFEDIYKELAENQE